MSQTKSKQGNKKDDELTMYTNKVMRSDMINYYKSVAGEGVVRSFLQRFYIEH